MVSWYCSVLHDKKRIHVNVGYEIGGWVKENQSWSLDLDWDSVSHILYSVSHIV